MYGWVWSVLCGTKYIYIVPIFCVFYSFLWQGRSKIKQHFIFPTDRNPSWWTLIPDNGCLNVRHKAEGWSNCQRVLWKCVCVYIWRVPVPRLMTVPRLSALLFIIIVARIFLPRRQCWMRAVSALKRWWLSMAIWSCSVLPVIGN